MTAVLATPDVSGVVLPGPAGSGVDALRAMRDLQVADELQAVLMRTHGPGARVLARLLAEAEPATRAALVAVPEAAPGLACATGAGAQRATAVAAGLLLAGPDHSVGFLVLDGAALCGSPLPLAHVHALVRDADGLPLAVEVADALVLTWPDGASATLPRGGASASGPVLGGRLVLGANAAGWRLLNGLRPRAAGDHALDLDDPRLPRAEPVLAEGVALLGEVWPEALSVARRHVRALVLLAEEGGATFSWTPRDLSGVVGLTARDPIQVADALVHESAHVRFDLARWQCPVLDDDGAAVHPAPWRPDPRPLEQVLYGLHAFLMVSLLYQRLVPLIPEVESVLERQRTQVQQAWAYLEPRLRPTQAGVPLVEELSACVTRS